MRIGAPPAHNRGVAPIADWRSGRFPQGGCRCPGGPGKDVYDLTSATSTVPRTPGRTTTESAATSTSSFAGHGNRARSTVRQKIDAYFAFLEERYAQLRPMIHIALRSLFRALRQEKAIFRARPVDSSSTTPASSCARHWSRVMHTIPGWTAHSLPPCRLPVGERHVAPATRSPTTSHARTGPGHGHRRVPPQYLSRVRLLHLPARRRGRCLPVEPGLPQVRHVRPVRRRPPLLAPQEPRSPTQRRIESARSSSDGGSPAKLASRRRRGEC